MKLMFNKKELYGKWFLDEEYNNEFTEKIPQHTCQEWNEEINEWIEKPQIEEPKDDEFDNLIQDGVY